MAAVALGAVLLLGANYVVAGRLAWTPGGLALSFGRMLQDGIVKRYLADHCPEQRLKLCAHRHELPTDADVFFWSGEGSVFNKLGRFDGLGDEMSTIVLGSLREYPGLQIEMALAATAHQLTGSRPAKAWSTPSGTPTGRSRNSRPALPPTCMPRASSTARSGLPRSTASTSRSRSPPCCCCSPPCCSAGAAQPFADLGMLAGDRDGGAAGQRLRLRRAVQPA